MTYNNPVVRGTAPDPSLVRVGHDYYLATSTFDMLPGITIRHSTDLVTWRIIGGAVSRPAQYRRDARPGPMVLFAPTLRHHDGAFYLVCTNAIAGQGNFLLTTEDPGGEWSDAVWIDAEGFDPSLFRDDDGTWYYTRRTLQFRPDGNLGPIVQAEIDLSTGALGELREVTPPHGFASNDIEGPHLYKRDGWYYLCSAEGGSWRGHMQTVARSRSPWGPFEAAPNTPLLTHRHRVASPIQSLGHAELFDAADGSSWAVSLGTRHPRAAQHHTVGRETFLTPVRWVDGWPVAGVDGDGTTSLSVAADTPEPGPSAVEQVADTLWTRGWRTIGAAPAGLKLGADGRFVVPSGPHPSTAHAGFSEVPVGALVRPQTGYDQAFTATLVGLHGDATAGVAAFTDPLHHYSITVVADGEGRRAVVTKVVDDLNVTTEVPLPPVGTVTLRITSHETHYAFEVAAGGLTTDLGTGSARLLSAEAAQWFVGVQWALLAVGERDGWADFADVGVAEVESAGHAAPVPFH